MENEKEKNSFGFPYDPYPIQKQLMTVLYQALEDGKVAILESPTGTGKSLSTICAALSWLENKKRKEVDNLQHEIQTLAKQIKDADSDDDWMAAHSRKLEAQNAMFELELKKNYQQQVEERLEKAKRNVNSCKKKKQDFFGASASVFKRKADDEVTIAKDNDNFNDDHQDVDSDLIPDELVLENKTDNDDEFSNNKALKEPLRSIKIIYASRTHSQLDQFVSELRKTQFQPRVLTVGSRQLLCVNDAVKSLKSSTLINDRCNELLNSKSTKLVDKNNKRLKGEDGFEEKKTVQEKVCGCEYFKANPIEDLADNILVRDPKTFSDNGLSWLTEAGKSSKACPYFASRKVSALCELVLVPYNILLHKATRETWNLDLKDNVVIVDEAHNLLQTVASIHSCELDENRLAASCSLMADYISKFKSRLSPRNFLYIRQLHTLSIVLLNLLRSLTNTKLVNLSNNLTAENDNVFTIPRFIAQLNCPDIDIFKLLSFLEESNLCRKLRDFNLRYSSQLTNGRENVTTEVVPSSTIKKASRLEKFLNKAKENIQKNNTINEVNVKNCSVGKKNEIIILNNKTVEKPANTNNATPLYQLKEFLEALTTRAEDARLLIQKATSPLDYAKYRFLLLNPAEKLKDIINEAHSFVLIGGTMKPLDQLLDAFHRVCGLTDEKIVQFSCGHVINDSQLAVLAIARGPSGAELNLCFSQRNRQSILSEIARSFVNLLRHVPNGVVAFFPSYSFLADFVNCAKTRGDFALIENVKSLFIESRNDNATNSENSVWSNFCKEAKSSAKGALLLAVVGGSLSEGINFSDELGRCVIMVGLPYANKNSVELCERMKYVDMKIGKNAGSRFYESLCIQAVNQAIGRAIRHRNDYAAIVLLDSRYLQENINKQLPQWIGQRLSLCKAFPECLSKLIGFFRSKKEN